MPDVSHKFARTAASGGSLRFVEALSLDAVKDAKASGDLVIFRWRSFEVPKKYELESLVNSLEIAGDLRDYVFIGWAPENVDDEKWKISLDFILANLRGLSG